ncbi:MAG: response regulator transcription factor [Deltaproteobacteria bacterium]|nr:MAG: response regulator transcription factor [Deltaproteobacteria bacterium]TMQ17160.1 MAG: response regulator transcription factor [Deltaproteobacteria bacterium]
MYRVLLVDDHEVVRRGLRAILDDRFAGIEVAEAGSGDQALASLADPFDAVILDLSMPGRSGIDLLAEIKHRHPRLPVLIMSLHGEEQFALRALRAGASGYLTKSAAPEQLISAFERIVRGGKYITETLAERLAAMVGGDAGAPHDRLSQREFEVMRGIASGESVGAIAERMHLSVKTVSTYRARLLEKMGMATNAELTRYAIQNGLV